MQKGGGSCQTTSAAPPSSHPWLLTSLYYHVSLTVNNEDGQVEVEDPEGIIQQLEEALETGVMSETQLKRKLKTTFNVDEKVGYKYHYFPFISFNFNHYSFTKNFFLYGDYTTRISLPAPVLKLWELVTNDYFLWSSEPPPPGDIPVDIEE